MIYGNTSFKKGRKGRIIRGVTTSVQRGNKAEAIRHNAAQQDADICLNCTLPRCIETKSATCPEFIRLKKLKSEEEANE